MKKITVSAPGKLMLFGEHAVVYGRPCIVTAVNQRIRATVGLLDISELQLEAPDVEINGYRKPIKQLGQKDMPRGAKFVEIAVRNFLDARSKNQEVREFGFNIITQSEFSSQFGFGSSSASTVCIVKALAELYELHVSNKELFEIAYQTVLDIQGKGSGFDIAAGIYGGTLYFVKGGKIIEPLALKKLPLIVGYSGIKADTVTLMNQVSKAFEDKEKQVTSLYNSMGKITNHAKEALLQNDFENTGDLMNENQKLLSELGVSIPKLDSMIDAARKAGAYGAKLSGGGGGDCMIALVSEEKKEAVKKAIISVGGIIVDVLPNAAGVKVE